MSLVTVVCHVFGSQRVIVVNVLEVVRIFQIHLQYVPIGSVAVHGIDVEIFGVFEKTEFTYGRGSDREYPYKLFASRYKTN